MKETVKRYRKALRNKEVLKDIVKIVHFDKELETDVLILDLQGLKGIVKKEEVDFAKSWNSLVGFVGREIHYVVTEIDESKGIVYCSRKVAQELSLEAITNRLESGEKFMGKIINFVPYGAFVEIEGSITGLLRDSNFASDYTKISDIIPRQGSEIFIQLKNIVQKGEFLEFEFEAVEKYKAPTILDFDEFEVGQVVAGEIKKIISNGMFVQIAPGLDALCPIPPFNEYKVRDFVKVRISKVMSEEGRVRGKIIPDSGTYQMM